MQWQSKTEQFIAKHDICKVRGKLCVFGGIIAERLFQKRSLAISSLDKQGCTFVDTVPLHGTFINSSISMCSSYNMFMQYVNLGKCLEFWGLVTTWSRQFH